MEILHVVRQDESKLANLSVCPFSLKSLVCGIMHEIARFASEQHFGVEFFLIKLLNNPKTPQN